jgi:hypothetical protein
MTISHRGFDNGDQERGETRPVTLEDDTVWSLTRPLRIRVPEMCSFQNNGKVKIPGRNTDVM